jgi:histone H3/H4
MGANPPARGRLDQLADKCFPEAVVKQLFLNAVGSGDCLDSDAEVSLRSALKVSLYSITKIAFALALNRSGPRESRTVEMEDIIAAVHLRFPALDETQGVPMPPASAPKHVNRMNMYRKWRNAREAT